MGKKMDWSKIIDWDLFQFCKKQFEFGRNYIELGFTNFPNVSIFRHYHIIRFFEIGFVYKNPGSKAINDRTITHFYFEIKNMEEFYNSVAVARLTINKSNLGVLLDYLDVIIYPEQPGALPADW